MTLLSEKEAGTKWCPFSRVALHAGTGGATANRHVSDGTTHGERVIEEETRCLGAGCMAWRWHDPLPERPSERTFAWPGWNVPDDVSFAEVKAMGEPPRPAHVPADWVSVPLTGDDWDNAEGGEWREPEADVDTRYQLECDRRRGFCGLAGSPPLYVRLSASGGHAL